MTDISKVENKFRIGGLASLLSSQCELYNNQQLLFLDYELGETFKVVKTFKETFNQAKNIMGNLKDNGVKKGDRVVVILDNYLESIPVIWSCILGGIKICPISLKLIDERNIQKK